jgi:streptogramin lyase
MDTAPRHVEPCPDQPPAQMEREPGPEATIPEPANLQRMEAFSTDFPQGLAVAAGSIWTANEFLDTVTRIDAATGKVTTIRVAPGFGPQRIAEAAEAVWAGGRGGLVRIDADSNAIDPRVAGCISSIVSAFGSLWAGETGGLLRVDPTTGLAVEEIRPDAAAGVVCGASTADDSVWLACGQDLYRIDPTTNAISASITGAGDVIAADGVAWLLAGMDPFTVATPEDAFTTIERLDLETNRLVPDTKTILVHGASVAGRLADGHVVWLSTSFGVGPGVGNLYAFEPASGKVTAAFDISEGKGYGSNAIAFAYGSMWTASGTANAVRRFPRPSP